MVNAVFHDSGDTTSEYCTIETVVVGSTKHIYRRFITHQEWLRGVWDKIHQS